MHTIEIKDETSEGIGTVTWTPPREFQEALDRAPPRAAEAMKEWMKHMIHGYILVMLATRDARSDREVLQSVTAELVGQIIRRPGAAAAWSASSSNK
jgi:hypothetical protein